MAFKYSCFISYCHCRGELMTGFMEELNLALKSHLEPYFDLDVYIDKERLKSGSFFNEAIAKAICQSICMIVVYVPKYKDHVYCRREYEAMKYLESKRKRLSGNLISNEEGLIIPIILRGEDEDIPPKIRGHRQFCDFRQATLVTHEIRNNPECMRQINDIALYIHKVFKKFQDFDDKLTNFCKRFYLPPEKKCKPWVSPPQKTIEPFPFREIGR